jgi:uncharacterized protein
MKKQVVVIHGGANFDRYKDYLAFLKNMKIDLDRFRKEGWKSSLRKSLGRNFDVLLLKMPNPTNAKYKEWEIVFRKIAPKLKNNVVLVGHSLGGIFLAKYLSEHKFPKKIKATFLLAAPYDDKGMDESLGDFKLPKNFKKFEKQGGSIFLYHSKDDRIVPFGHVKKYKEGLPEAVVRVFKKKGHFNQETFPELVRNLKKV